jgi:hypothetical protein
MEQERSSYGAIATACRRYELVVVDHVVVGTSGDV